MRPARIAILIAAIALHAAAARADTTAPIVVWSVAGGLDLSLAIYDAVTIARKISPGLAYGIAELVLAVPQLLVGPLLIAVGGGNCGLFCADADARTLFLGAGITLTALAAALLAHGIWSTATRGWANAPHTHALLTPTLVGDSAHRAPGLALTGRF